jgi:hypothetical protein
MKMGKPAIPGFGVNLGALKAQQKEDDEKKAAGTSGVGKLNLGGIGHSAP